MMAQSKVCRMHMTSLGKFFFIYLLLALYLHIDFHSR